MELRTKMDREIAEQGKLGKQDRRDKKRRGIVSGKERKNGRKWEGEKRQKGGEGEKVGGKKKRKWEKQRRKGESRVNCKNRCTIDSERVGESERGQRLRDAAGEKRA